MYEIIDLHFQGFPHVIASYVLRGPAGVAVIETGPASTYPALKAGLAGLGIELTQVTDVLVTHVHLDHSGAAGWLARDSGATVHVHTVGAPHLADPGKLLSSAQRIYGEDMDRLWGKTVAVPAGQVHALQDGDVIDAAGLRLVAVDTPGHAYHHMAYLLDGLCFTGDVAAVRFPGLPHVRVPTPPPEIDLPAWRRSLARLRGASSRQPTSHPFWPGGGGYLRGFAGCRKPPGRRSGLCPCLLARRSSPRRLSRPSSPGSPNKRSPTASTLPPLRASR